MTSVVLPVAVQNYEGAGAAHLARYVGRHREALADPVGAARRKYVAVPARQRDHAAYVRPSKTAVGSMACPPHRINRPKLRLLVKIGPALRIIMDEDWLSACCSEIDMMGKGIIVEAHLRYGSLQFALQPRLIVGAQKSASETFHKSQSTHGLHRFSIARAFATRETRVSPSLLRARCHQSKAARNAVAAQICQNFIA